MSEVMNSHDDKEIDFVKLISDLWQRRKFIFKCVGIGIFLGLVVAFSLPSEYVTSSQIVPEYSSSSQSKLSGLSGLAAMAGINTGGVGGGGDAINASMYPNVVSSYPFMSELFDLEVTTSDGELTTTLYDYIDEHQKSAWWSVITSAPFKLLGFIIGLVKGENDEVVSSGFDTEKPTFYQYQIYKKFLKRISVTADPKTYTLFVTVKMQDPEVALSVAKVVLNNLQEYITDYRTKKVKNNLAYSEKVYADAKDKYYEIQSEYAKFMDQNKNITSSIFRTEQERLQNDMTLALSIYTNLATTLEETKLKVQEQTPVYTILSPPIKATDNAEPNKPMILIVFTFLAGVAAVAYRIFKDKLIEF